MYQVPVQRLDRIRTSRKRVKEILTDIGLDSCQDFLKEDKSGDNGEQCYENTEWNDLTDCYQTKRKKWCYRTQPLCCSLCWFSCRSWQTFRNHVQRCHDEEGDLASLSPCPACAYICRPDLLSKHAKLFHAQPQAAPAGSSNGNTGNKVTKTLARMPVSVTQAGVRVTTLGPGGDKYSCAACGYHDSLLYVMRKHVLLTHCKALLQRYYSCQVTTLKKRAKPAPNESPGSNETWTTVKQSKFSCCVCKMPAETSEHLLYHLLSSAKHQELQAHIKPLLVEHCSVAKIAPAGSKASELPHLAPRALQQVVSLVAKGMMNLPPVNGKSAPPKKAVLVASHSQPTSLVCSAGGGAPQVLVANQKAASGVAVRAAPGQPSCSNKPVSFVMSSGAQGNQIPLTMTMTGSSPGQTQQVLLPAGLTLNLGTKMGSVGSPGQPLLFSQGRGGQIEMQVTTSSGQQMVLTQGKATTAGAGTPQTLLSDGKAAGGQAMVLTQGKTLGPSVVLAPSNTNSFSAMAPNQSLMIGGQVGSVRPMLLNQGLSIQSQQQGGTLLSSHPTLGFIATGNKMGPGQSLMLNQGLSLQSSQSVRLIPTGNKVNGMPTYTLAAVQMAVPVQSGVAKPPVLVNVPPQAPPVAQANPSAAQTNRAVLSSPTGKVPSSSSLPVPRANPGPVPAKRAAVSAPTGKATAPSVPKANLSTAQTQRTEGSTPTGVRQANTVLPRLRSNRGTVSSPKGKALGAKSQFVTWSASGVLECLLCKSVFPDHGLHLHLLHGMKCLLCPLVFYTFRQLVSHCDEAHGLAAAVNRDQLWKNHRLLVTKDSRLLSPKPIVSLKVPQDLLGCPELHLALVHKDTDLEVMHLQLTERLTKAPVAPANGQPSCPFCTDLRPRGPAADVQHLRRRHHVMHAIHAILKTPAFKCVYCLGVYMEPSSARTISIHVQRCRCAPHSAKEAERRLNPDPAGGRAASRRGVAAAREGLEAPPGPEPYDNSPTEIPAGLAQRPLSEKKLFLNKYFHKTPYPTRKEIEFLVLRLKLSQPEVTSIFSSKRRRCREDCRRRGLRVLLGFDSSHLKAVKHNLVIPHGQTSQGPRASKDTQTPTLVECKQEPPDPVEIVGPFGDHPYAEPLTHPGSLQCKKEDPDRTVSGGPESGEQP
ncbi:unnamed protein product [Arctogadus glacialis]